ncbi:M-phase inducer phosphatase 3 isoform X2 [Microcaecilia unicolor]|uniref:M-phase inducer phosphatase n=1 Tax=Microcaecilia unicolor TaxID=1415580 RepID=A0A6P7YCU0_9AMPH|nr:M-phase inducer phosphatase 3-like isoform X2 [Microcaecilia unicolor]
MESTEERSSASEPGSSDDSLQDALTFSPDLGLSPVLSLEQLTCLDSVTPRRRLKLSPDSQSPSPTTSLSHPVAMGTLTLTGVPVESSPSPAGPQSNISQPALGSSSPRLRKSLGRAKVKAEEENRIPLEIGKKKSRMKLSDLFQHHELLQAENEKKFRSKKKPDLHDRGKQSFMRNARQFPEPGALLPVKFNIGQIPDSETEDENLIGDFSKTYCLPVEDGKHQDLKYISSATVASLLNGQYDQVVEKYYVVDCRFPYEYKGGHIKGALNLYREEQLKQAFFQKPQCISSVQRRIIMIFHCEFSSERGPRLCRTLRQLDRNANSYPCLYYPELYILKGGYKEFYENFKGLCEPQAYVHMLHQDFQEELKGFHRETKPWTARRIRKKLFKPQAPR